MRVLFKKVTSLSRELNHCRNMKVYKKTCLSRKTDYRFTLLCLGPFSSNYAGSVILDRSTSIESTISTQQSQVCFMFHSSPVRFNFFFLEHGILKLNTVPCCCKVGHVKKVLRIPSCRPVTTIWNISVLATLQFYTILIHIILAPLLNSNR